MKAWADAPRRTKAAAVFAAFVLVVLLITTVFGKKGVIEIIRTRRNHAALGKTIDLLKDEKGRLEKRISELETNPKAVEREARDDLWLAKPDEKIVIKKKK